MTLNASIGNRIAKLRKSHHLTQEQLAEKLDISIKHCSAVERGISRLSLEYLIEVSDIFDVSLDYLIRGNNSESSDSNQLISTLPSSVLSIIHSNNEKEIMLLQEYLQLYLKLRNHKNN